MEIPDGVTTIGSGAFSGCRNLTSVTIPTSVITIGNIAFSGCTGMTSVAIPDSVTGMGSGVFNNCSSMTAITVASGNTAYQDVDGVLYSKDGKTLVRYPVGKSGTTYTIPDGVTTIDSYAFYNCSGLNSVEIPDGVTTIDSGAFYNCSGLTTVTIPSSVTTIGNYAFANCSSLNTVRYGGTAARWKTISVGNHNNPLTSATIHYNAS